MGIQQLQIAPDYQSVPFPPAVPVPVKLERPASASEAPILFGDFMLLPRERALIFNGVPVELGSRAFDLLTVLVRSSGKIVSKDELVSYVWPSTFVDDSNLRFQMATLRKALGEARGMIKTIPGRGYLFVGDPEEQRNSSQPVTAAMYDLFNDSSVASPQTNRPHNDSGCPAPTRFTVLVIEGAGNFRELLDRVLQSADQEARVLELHG